MGLRLVSPGLVALQREQSRKNAASDRIDLRGLWARAERGPSFGHARDSDGFDPESKERWSIRTSTTGQDVPSAGPTLGDGDALTGRNPAGFPSDAISAGLVYADPVTDDFELLDRWRSGDRAAGTALFERHFARIVRFFANKVDRDVDDLVQRTFTACVEGRDRFEGRSTFRTFLFAIAHNVLRSHLRTLQRPQRSPDALGESIQDWGLNPSLLVAERREQALILQALRRIPVESQTILELYYWEEMTAGEIGSMFAIPEGTARGRIRRAKQQLEVIIRELESNDALVESTLSGLESWARALRLERGDSPPLADES